MISSLHSSSKIFLDFDISALHLRPDTDGKCYCRNPLFYKTIISVFHTVFKKMFSHVLKISCDYRKHFSKGYIEG